MNFVYVIPILFLSSPVYAACLDIGSELFAKNLVAIQLCIGSVCEVAVRTWSCGNVHYESEDYSAESMTWLFRHRMNVVTDNAPDQYFVLRNPIDLKDRPLVVLEGKSLWTLKDELPLAPDKVQQMTCSPESAPDACSFVDKVLRSLRHP